MGPIKRSVISIAMASLLPFVAFAQTPAAAHNEHPSTIGTMPTRGMNMTQVQKYFGKPDKIVKAVGDPPIGRWIYDGFVVYFEHKLVIHALVTSDDH